jgi:hypothetical protein
MTRRTTLCIKKDRQDEPVVAAVEIREKGHASEEEKKRRINIVECLNA